MIRSFLTLCAAQLFVGAAYAATLADIGAGDLVVSEIMPYPTGVATSKGQWFEVYNASGVPVNLNGLVVEGTGLETFTVTTSPTLAAGGYALFATRSDAALNGGLPTITVKYATTSFSLSNASDTITLKFGGTTFDSVSYDNGVTYPDPYGKSINLSPLYLDATDNDTGGNWCESYSSYGSLGNYGTPGAANDDCMSALSALSAGDLIITEVMSDPALVTDSRGEWFEIYNDSSTYVDLFGLYVYDSGTDDFTVNKHIGLLPGEFALFAVRDVASYNGGLPTVDYKYTYSTDMTLAGNDSLAISFGGTIFDAVTWTGGTFPVVAGKAMELANTDYDATDNNSGANWCAADDTSYGLGDFGTPAADNSDCTVDNDGDGFGTATDCDDADALVFPGADEECDGQDNDCDGSTDESSAIDASTWYDDDDTDTFGDAADSTVACSQPAGYVANDDDCNDASAMTTTGSTFYDDDDNDMYGDPADSVVACARPSGYRPNNLDCDDTDSGVSPSDAEACDGEDNDCDGTTDEGVTTTYYDDDDSDGYGDVSDTTQACSVPAGYSVNDDDCDDTEADANPGETEVCDAIDNDCDATIDEDSAADAATWYLDADSDTYGHSGTTDIDCDQPAGYVANDDDCDDGAAGIHPGAAEVCDGVDDDCDALVDDGVTTTYYDDDDGDTYGDAADDVEACSQPAGYVGNDDDCDDAAAAVNPAATEVCDSIDNDCNGQSDEDSAADVATWYDDDDGDSYGDAGDSDVDCDQPAGFVANDDDCDDADADANPGETELCDGIDNDCDAQTDEDSAADAATWYIDADADTYGHTGTTDVQCAQPGGYVANDDDCDDGDADVNPSESEECDAVDNDCDGSTDEDSAIDATTWYADADSDTYGDAGAPNPECVQPGGHVANDDDCDDSDADVNPGESELCDGTDNNCSGDEDDASNAITWYDDDDGDSYGDAMDTFDACAQPAGYAGNDDDCDDGDTDVNPGETEVCNDGIDSDCDGTDSGSGCSSDLSVADATFYGESYLDTAGYSVSGAGDVNNDGFDDVIIGARLDDDAGADAGAAYVVFGPVTGTVGLASADAKLTGQVAGDHAGVWVSGGGDIDGDGFDDVLVGANFEDTNGSEAGATYVVHGPFSGSVSLDSADAKLTGLAASDGAGEVVSVVGDVNNDGNADIFVGASGEDTTDVNAGAAYLFYGPASDGDLDTADVTFFGAFGQDFAGYWLDGAGDVDGDGLDDLIVSGYRADTEVEGNTVYNVGKTYLVYGTPPAGDNDLADADAIFAGETANDQSGSTLSRAGDVDNDGYGDFLIGAQHRDSNGTDAGTAYLILGGALNGEISLEDADATITGEAAGDFAGRGLGAAGDLDGDGHDDILIGSKKSDGNGSDSGAAYVLLGPVSGTVSLSAADATWYGETNADQAGIWVSGAGDVSGDGSPDFLVGATLGSPSEAGAAYLLLGDAWQ